MQAFPDSGALRSPQSLDDLLLYRIWRAENASSSTVNYLVEGGFGITHSDWRMIGVLAQIGEMTSSELAAHLHLDWVSISCSLRGLLEKKLLQRLPNAEDGPEALVRLSPSGHRLFDDLFPRLASLNVRLLEGIDAAHIDVFLHCLHRLELRGRELNEHEERAGQRSRVTRRI